MSTSRSTSPPRSASANTNTNANANNNVASSAPSSVALAPAPSSAPSPLTTTNGSAALTVTSFGSQIGAQQSMILGSAPPPTNSTTLGTSSIVPPTTVSRSATYQLGNNMKGPITDSATTTTIGSSFSTPQNIHVSLTGTDWELLNGHSQPPAATPTIHQSHAESSLSTSMSSIGSPHASISLSSSSVDASTSSLGAASSPMLGNDMTRQMAHAPSPTHQPHVHAPVSSFHPQATPSGEHKQPMVPSSSATWSQSMQQFSGGAGSNGGNGAQRQQWVSPSLSQSSITPESSTASLIAETKEIKRSTSTETPTAAAAPSPAVVASSTPSVQPAAAAAQTTTTDTDGGNITSVAPLFFVNPVPPDYQCTICRNVPLRPLTPSCCGAVCCTPCITKALAERESKGLSGTCQFCNEPAQPPIQSPFAQLKIGAEVVRCIHSDSKDTGCRWQSSLGKEGKRLIDHLAKDCEFGLVSCPGCGQRVQRRHLAAHRGPATSPDDCQHKPTLCVICDVMVSRERQSMHEQSTEHRNNEQKRGLSLVSKVATLERELKELTHTVQVTVGELERAKVARHTLQVQYEERITALSLRFDQKIAEIQTAASAKFVEIDINNWSGIHVKSMAECTALYSAATPLREWGHEWWLKVEKALDGRVGLYLCCGTDDPTPPSTAAGLFGHGAASSTATGPNQTNMPNTQASSRWPITCDYQLLARRRGTDEAVCCSVVFRTEFGRERAWGLSRFATLEVLEREGAYSRTEDKLTFGCVIFPGRNLRWGQLPAIRRAPAPAPTTAPAGTLPPPPPPSTV